jgi:hypothetical protein
VKQRVSLTKRSKTCDTDAAEESSPVTAEQMSEHLKRAAAAGKQDLTEFFAGRITSKELDVRTEQRREETKKIERRFKERR